MNDDTIQFINQQMAGLSELTKIQQINYSYNSRKLVHQIDKIKLFYYRAKKKLHSTPILVVFATVNRPEILDLFPEKSFIRGLLNAGFDVYLLDWGYPDEADTSISFADYIQKYLQVMVEFICEKKKISAIHLIGICQGGLISLCYTAIAKNIKKLVLISTPIDFHTDNNLVAQLVRKINFTENKNILGTWLTQFFISLRPFELIGKKYLRFTNNLHDQKFKNNFLQVEKWLHDAPDQPARAFYDLLKNFYQENKLIKNKIRLDNKVVNLKKIDVPILNVMASQDEIVPMSASAILKKYIAENLYHELIFPSGHIGIYISDKVGITMPTKIAEWLKV